MNRIWTVYMHIFPNGKKYIGITKLPPEKRWLNGKGYTKCGKRNSPMANAISKYGWENVEHSILFENLSFKEANEKEKELIAEYKTNSCKYGNQYGYNATDGGDGQHGHVMSPEAREKLSQNHKGLLAGEKHPASKAVACDGKEYVSVKEFAIFAGLKRETVKQWLNGKTNMPVYWYEKGLRYRDIKIPIKPQKRPHRKQVICDGVVFNSLTEASKYLQMDFRVVSSWLLGKIKIPQEYVDRGLSYV